MSQKTCKTCLYASYHGYCDLKQKWTDIEAIACDSYEVHPHYQALVPVANKGKKPCLGVGDLRGKYLNWLECRNCGEILVYGWYDGEKMPEIDGRNNYCRNCGRKIDFRAYR